MFTRMRSGLRSAFNLRQPRDGGPVEGDAALHATLQAERQRWAAERQMLLTDFLYSRALIEILTGADGEGTFPLGAARDVALLALLQEMPSRGDGTTAGEDRQRVADLFAQSIGSLSHGRFDLVVSVLSVTAQAPPARCAMTRG